MKIFSLAIASLLNRKFTVLLTVIAIALSVHKPASTTPFPAPI